MRYIYHYLTLGPSWPVTGPICYIYPWRQKIMNDGIVACNYHNDDGHGLLWNIHNTNFSLNVSFLCFAPHSNDVHHDEDRRWYLVLFNESLLKFLCTLSVTAPFQIIYTNPCPIFITHSHVFTTVSKFTFVSYINRIYSMRFLHQILRIFLKS